MLKEERVKQTKHLLGALLLLLSLHANAQFPARPVLIDNKPGA